MYEDFATVSAAAEFADVTQQCIYNWISKGVIHARGKDPRGWTLVSLNEIEEMERPRAGRPRKKRT